MKKLLLLVFLFVPLYVNADGNIEKVFKLESFVLNEMTNNYTIAQYGSAVYLSKDLIYTNAHVVLDEDDKPIGNYRVCKTIDFKKNPVCFSVGKLLYYDIKNDLAVLSIVNPGVETIKTSSKILGMGDIVKVYGYPSTGGKTITYTEGKVSGFDNGLYKIDANIDSGNSGGGVFDLDGNLIGIAVSVKVGYSSLGYIIPISKLNDFKNKINKNNIVEFYNKISSKFYLNTLRNSKVIGASSYSNKDIKLSGFTKYGFNINYYSIDNYNKFYALGLIDNNKETMIISVNSEILSDKLYNIDVIKDRFKVNFEKLKKSGKIELYKVRKIKLYDKNTVIAFSKDSEGIVNLFLIIENGINRFQTILLNSDNINNKSFLNGLRIILKKMKINPLVTPLVQKGKLLNFDNLNISMKDGFYIKKNYMGDSLGYLGDDIVVEEGISQKNKIEIYKEYSLSSFIKSSYLYDKDYAYIKYYGIKKTSFGEYYNYFYFKNNEYKGKEIDKDEKKYKIKVNFFDKIDEKEFYSNTISFTFDKLESKIIIDSFLSSIKTSSGKLPIKLGDLEIGKNIVIKKDF